MTNILSQPPVKSPVTLPTGSIAPVWNQWFQIIFSILGGQGLAQLESLTITSNQIIIQNSQTPATSSSPGEEGTICWDTNYVYVCIAENTWKRIGISTW